MKLRTVVLFALLAIVPVCSMQAQSCLSVPGSYSLGEMPNATVAASPTGPWTMTSTGDPYTGSHVDFIPSASFTFSQLQSLSATFTSNAGGASIGSPRFALQMDENANGLIDATDGYLFIFLGTPGGIDSDAQLNTWSNQNLIGDTTVGRYDLSQVGGSPYTTYADALSTAGSLRVLDIMFVVDTWPPHPDRNLTLQSINTCALLPDLQLTKTFVSGDARPGGAVHFQLDVTNVGGAATSGTITVTEQPGAGLTVTAMSGSGWTCNVGTLTCTTNVVVSAGASLPPIGVDATIATGGDAVATNAATVSGGGNASAANDAGAADVNVIGADVPTLDARALAALVAILALLGARRLFS